ncbi:metallophosphoesterase [Nocardioides sp. cx-173]|uniref:metallophosphoesterase family protein n=1 Tax=Nocardioides sp. cx-173 TaxID=2898796 RepID=UPI001E28944A|nr:metallophosphoesterase family protein [Nocardioides sp. cx-173]MCD4524499.1 metallophosphatase family protein [Nocardioides sp. cx-173]UGB43016.1 metallophosphatase family protein [Nocardioides sp. cx-173]
MPQRIAVLSDVHGVLPALEAVLAEPDVAGADVVVVTGDLAAGPQPAQVLDRLAALGDRGLLVRGNADRDLVTIAGGGEPPEGTPPVDLWAAAQLSDSHVATLAALPHPVVLTLDGAGDVLFCHGTPRDDNEVVLVDTRLSRWHEVLADVPASVRTVVCGHTHMPFARLLDRRWVVNSGSVGMPYGSTGLPWALLTAAGIQLRTTPVDADALADAVVAASSFPDVAEWADTYVRRPLGDTVAVTAFAPRDGRDAGWDD